MNIRSIIEFIAITWTIICILLAIIYCFKLVAVILLGALTFYGAILLTSKVFDR